MPGSTPPVEFLDYLPVALRSNGVNGDGFIRRFLQIFDSAFSDFRREMDAIPSLFDPETLPSLFGVTTLGASTPSSIFPPQNDTPQIREMRAKAFLEWLAGWIGLPHRIDKSAIWNAAFIRAAIPLVPLRGTLDGLRGLLKAYLAGDVGDVSVSDVGGFIVGVSRLGIDTRLNDDANLPYQFTVSLTGLTNRPDAAREAERHTRQLLDHEAPAHTVFRIRIMTA